MWTGPSGPCLLGSVQACAKIKEGGVEAGLSGGCSSGWRRRAVPRRGVFTTYQRNPCATGSSIPPFFPSRSTHTTLRNIATQSGFPGRSYPDARDRNRTARGKLPLPTANAVGKAGGLFDIIHPHAPPQVHRRLRLHFPPKSRAPDRGRQGIGKRKMPHEPRYQRQER